MDKQGKMIGTALVIVGMLLVVFAMARPSTRSQAACNDNADNDGDTYTDYPSDPGCSSRRDTSEYDPNVQCDDGSDNDGDSYADYPSDPGCASVTDTNEHNSAVQCDDGLDNDGDGATDYSSDAGCSSPTDTDETNCGDSVTSGSETCDGNSQSCTTTSGYPGTQICNGQCSGFGSCTSTQYCGDGICNGAETSSSCSQDCHANSCSDTDGGFSIRWRGTVSGYYNNASYNYTDYCQSSALLNEYFCSSNTSNSSAYNCSSINSTAYCSNGGCN